MGMKVNTKSKLVRGKMNQRLQHRYAMFLYVNNIWCSFHTAVFNLRIKDLRKCRVYILHFELLADYFVKS